MFHERGIQFTHLAYLLDHDRAGFETAKFTASEKRQDERSGPNRGSLLDSTSNTITVEGFRVQPPAISESISSKDSLLFLRETYLPSLRLAPVGGWIAATCHMRAVGWSRSIGRRS